MELNVNKVKDIIRSHTEGYGMVSLTDRSEFMKHDHCSRKRLWLDYGVDSISTLTCLNSCENACVLVPRQEWIFSTSCLRFIQIRPSPQELLVRWQSGQLASDSPIHQLRHVKIRGEQNIKVSLMYLMICQLSTSRPKYEELTKGVETGTVLLWYLVCTTGAFTPLTASGKSWKSLVISRCAGKCFARMSKNCINLVGMYSGSLRFGVKGSMPLSLRINRFW